MTDAPDNPAAFPSTNNFGNDQPGMTLRDWFAGQALAGMLAHREADYSPLGKASPEHFADSALAIADAIHTTRKAKP